MKEHMKRTWDETKSPQWRYLLGQESEQKRELRKGLERGEGEIKRNKLGRDKKNRKVSARQKEYSKKTGREIIYSASPGRSLLELQDLKHNKNEQYRTTQLSTEPEKQE